MKAQVYKEQNLCGEVTAFLALIFVLLVGFTGSVMESASLQSAKSYRRADMNRAIESVFAEYQKDMLEEFDLFVLDASYESGDYSEARILDRLTYYGASGMDQKMECIQLLTDQGGLALNEQIANYVENKYGIGSLNLFEKDESEWKDRMEEAEESEKEEAAVEGALSDILTENNQELPTEDNPLPNIQHLLSLPLSELVMPSGTEVSDAKVDETTLVSGRTLEKGYGDFEGKAENATSSKAVLGEYAMTHFDSAVEEESEGTLCYELEYLIAGKDNDRENLDVVLRKILMLRLVPNYVYLQQDAAKKAEAEALAITLCTVIALPAAGEAAAQAILLAWAVGESVMDLRSLMKGGKVPLVKTEESWQLSLTGLMKLGTEEDTGASADIEEGLDYCTYLRGILLLTNREKLTMRMLDLIELCMRNEKGLSWFYADHCVSRMEVVSKVQLRRGITYDFHTYYSYR